MFEELAKNARRLDIAGRLREDGDEYGAQLYDDLEKASAGLDELRAKVKAEEKVDSEEYFAVKDFIGQQGEIIISRRRSPFHLSRSGQL